MIEICKDHTGKMEGIQSISTSVVLNPNCQKNQKIRGSICSKCYAQNMAEMYTDLAKRLERNTATLTERVLAEDELPDTTGQEIFRFESFGDLNNEIQLINYINIVKKNPGTRFTLWTKMYNLAYNYFSKNEVPANFTLILSSLMTNLPMTGVLEKFCKLGKFEAGQIKLFTVYDKKYIREHYKDVDINCGSRLCNGCKQCYLKNKVTFISEILKTDQPAVERFLDSKNPEHLDKMGRMFDNLSSLIGGK